MWGLGESGEEEVEVVVVGRKAAFSWTREIKGCGRAVALNDEVRWVTARGLAEG